MEASQREERVTPIELFFDLVFVFAITQVTTMLSSDPTWGGVGRALLSFQVSSVSGSKASGSYSTPVAN